MIEKDSNKGEFVPRPALPPNVLAPIPVRLSQTQAVARHLHERLGRPAVVPVIMQEACPAGVLLLACGYAREGEGVDLPLDLKSCTEIQSGSTCGRHRHVHAQKW